MNRSPDWPQLTQFCLDNFTDSSIWLNPEGRILYVNDATCRSLGYNKEELLSMHIWDLDPNYPPENYKETWEQLKRNDSKKFESIHVKKDGSAVPVEVSVNYINYGQNEYLVSFDREIKDRKEYERLLRSRLEFEKLITGLSTNFINLPPEEIDSGINDALNRIGNYTKADRSYIFLFKDNGAIWDNQYEWCAECVSPRISNLRGINAYMEYPWLLKKIKNLETIHIPCISDLPGEACIDKSNFEKHDIKSLALVPMMFNRSMIGLIGFDSMKQERRWTEDDISFLKIVGELFANALQRKKKEEELIEARIRAELYVDLMGHDINNMNQIAMGYLELAQDLLRSREDFSEEELDLISKPINALKNSSKLIDNVKKLQMEKDGKYKPEIINLGNLLEDVQGQYDDYGERDVRISINSLHDCYVLANALLKDVFLNLVGNAIKHSSGKVNIRIGMERISGDYNDFCRVTVEDNGPGIPDELKKKLFNRLCLARTKATGKGFGLCLIKMLVDDFMGHFQVEDRVPGDHSQGAKFIVTLPLQPYTSYDQISRIPTGYKT